MTRLLPLTLALLFWPSCAHAQTRQQLIRQVAQLKQEKAALVTQNATLTATVTTLKGQAAGTVTAQQSIKDRLAAAEAQVVTLTAERDDARRIAVEATTERDTARLAEAAAISRLTLSESAQARQQQVINDLMGQVTTRTAELAAAQVTITEQAGRIKFLETSQPKIPEDWSVFYWDAMGWYDASWMWRDLYVEEREKVRLRDLTIATIPLVEQGLRDRLLAAEANAVPNLEGAARIATLEMQLAESESRNQPALTETEARLVVEQQRNASLAQWVTLRYPAVLGEWEQHHVIVETQGETEP